MPTVKNFMTKNVVTIDAQKTVFEAAKLMRHQGVGDLVVTESKTPKGIVTERDIVRRAVAQKRPLDIKVSEIMSTPLITIGENASLKEAARKMVKNQIRRLPVTKENELVGIIATSDFARHLSQKTHAEIILEAIGRYPLT
jgi:CBS domain-containing protein